MSSLGLRVWALATETLNLWRGDVTYLEADLTAEQPFVQPSLKSQTSVFRNAESAAAAPTTTPTTPIITTTTTTTTTAISTPTPTSTGIG